MELIFGFKHFQRILLLSLLFLSVNFINGQQISIAPYLKIETGNNQDIVTLKLSDEGDLLLLADKKGNVQLWDVNENTLLVEQSIKAKIVFIDFLKDQKQAIIVSDKGNVSILNIEDLSVIREIEIDSKDASVQLDPNKKNLSLLSKEGVIHLYDLKANMSRAKSDISHIVNKPLFMGFDRFGQSIACISELGDIAIWNPINQKILRQLKLQSGEYYGSRSVLQTASTSKGSDYFVVSLQEIFIPKGGLKPGQQPERRNMIIVYDWETGNEIKRIKTNNRIDDIAYGPGPEHIIVSSQDKDEIQLINIDKGDIKSAIDLDGEAIEMTISENNQVLAVGSQDGLVFIFDLERNNTADIQIFNPPINQGIQSVDLQSNEIEVKGKINDLSQSSSVVVNNREVTVDQNGHFSASIDLMPGKNRISVIASDDNSNHVVKDIYVNRTITEAVPIKTSNASFHSQKRVALVIGNSNYEFSSPLRNPINDANAMSEVLSELNFEVTKILDGNYEQIKNSIYKFGSKIQDVDVALFYYAGHGLEVEGANYLVPVDANIQSSLDVKLKTIPLTGILRTIEYSNDESLNLLILDACRNNPFPTGKRGGSGLAKETAPSGTLIAYATDPGSVASDGDGENGLYTGELVKQMQIPQRIEDVFMNTRNNVEAISKDQQRPWEEARLKGVFYLKYE